MRKNSGQKEGQPYHYQISYTIRTVLDFLKQLTLELI